MTDRPSAVCALLTLGIFATAGSVQAQVSYSHEFPGWRASLQDGTVWLYRWDRNMARTTILLLPEDRNPVTSTEAATARANAIRDSVAAAPRSRCSGLQSVAGTPNGMGLEFKDDAEATKCYLFVGATKQGRIFANVWRDAGEMDRKSRPFQNVAGLFLTAAVARIEGRAVLPDDSGTADLASVVDAVQPGSRPERMLVIHRAAGPDRRARYAPVVLVENNAATDCAGWDPLFFTPSDLSRARVEHSRASLHAGQRCSLMAWKDDAESGTMLFENGEWGPATRMGHHDVIDTTVLPFAKGETFFFMTGARDRLVAVVTGRAHPRTLEPGDAWFDADGRFVVADIGLRNSTERQARGRYHVDGHIIVLELDSGPVLVGLTAKFEKGGKVAGLFLGAADYGTFQ